MLVENPTRPRGFGGISYFLVPARLDGPRVKVSEMGHSTV